MSENTPSTPQATACACKSQGTCICNSILMLALWISLLAAFGLLFCGSILGIILCLAAAFLISIILLFKGKVLAGLSGLFAGALTTALIAVLGVLLVPVVIISAITEQDPTFKQEVQKLLADEQALQAYLAKNLPTLNAALQEKNACTPATPSIPSLPPPPWYQSDPNTVTPSTPSAPASEITPEQKTATPEAVAEKVEVTTSASPQNKAEELTFDRIVTPQKADTPSQDQDSDDDKDTASEDQNDGDDDDNSDDLDDEK